ncbi:MAG: efflux RND transporter periplasmic adaptor subunit [Armatimonadetes bacterium]|nr:efflux RND transporter periplasmic adaptor subunit [Armatimonadota bacterium]
MTRTFLPFLALVSILSSGCMGGAGAKKDAKAVQKVERGNVLVQVVETGSLEADKTVEVKSRVSGRVKHLYVDEGEMVTKGQLIAEIDPQETLLQVQQNEAQVKGAQAGAERQAIEIAQRRVTAANNLDKARSNLRQVQMELKVQPNLTSSSLVSSKSALDGAKQAYDQLVAVTQPNSRTATEVALKDAQNAYGNANNELKRQESLLGQGYVSRRDVENATLQLQLAETKLRNAQEAWNRTAESQRLERQQAEERIKQAQAEYDRARANTIQDGVKKEQYLRAVREVSDAEAQLRDVSSLRAGLRQQNAQIEQLQSVLRDGQRQLGETKILAPLTGMVTKRAVQEGELVASLNSFSAGSTIVKVEDRSKMVVKLSINEIDVAKLGIGTRAEVTVDALPDQKFDGKVSKIAPASTASSTPGSTGQGTDTVVKYEVEVVLDQSIESLKSGMSAKCTMKVVDRKDVLRLPVDYVGKDDQGDYIMLAPQNKKDPKAKGTRVSVKLGAQSSSFVEILTGATEGQEVVKPDYKGPERKGMMSFGPDE